MGDTSMAELGEDIRRALAETSGAAIGDGYVVAFSGACPVQGYGHIDGHFCYFKARHDSFKIEIYAEDSGVNDEQTFIDLYDVDPVFTYEGDADNAGWQPAACSIKQIEDAVAEFRSTIVRLKEVFQVEHCPLCITRCPDHA